MKPRIDDLQVENNVDVAKGNLNTLKEHPLTQNLKHFTEQGRIALFSKQKS